MRNVRLCVLVGALLAHPALLRAEDSLSGHGTLSATLGASVLHVADYREIVSRWGHDGPTFGGEVAFCGGAFATSWLFLGGRAGWFWAGAGEATADAAPLTLSMASVDLVARFGFSTWSPTPRPELRGSFFGATLEGGAGLAGRELRGVTVSQVVPRLGVGAVGQLFLGRVGFGFQMIERFSWWADAAGPGVPLTLQATELVGSVEVAL